MGRWGSMSEGRKLYAVGFMFEETLEDPPLVLLTCSRPVFFVSKSLLFLSFFVAFAIYPLPATKAASFCT